MSPVPPETSIKPRITVDEIEGILSDIARDESAGPDRFRALKTLQAVSGVQVGLPPPITDPDVVERLTRLNKAAGQDLARVAFANAFPKRARPIDVAPAITVDQAPREMVEKVAGIRNLRGLYKMFPELKAPGLPTGFPRGRSLEAQASWCRRVALEMLIEARRKEQDAHNRAVLDDARTPEAATDGTGPAMPAEPTAEEPEPSSG